MSKLKYKVEFKKNSGSYQSKEYEFNDERHFDNWYKKQSSDNSYRKIVGFERIYEKEKNFSNDDLYQAFIAGAGQKFKGFEDWYKLYFKQNPE